MTLDKRESTSRLGVHAAVLGAQRSSHNQKLSHAQHPVSEISAVQASSIRENLRESLSDTFRQGSSVHARVNASFDAPLPLNVQKLSFAGFDLPTELRVLESDQSTRVSSPKTNNETERQPRLRKRRFADVVAITMLAKTWLSSVQDARVRGARIDARRQIHAALVFEPLPVALEKAASLFDSTSVVFSSQMETTRSADICFQNTEPGFASPALSTRTNAHFIMKNSDDTPDLINTVNSGPIENSIGDSNTSNHLPNGSEAIGVAENTTYGWRALYDRSTKRLCDVGKQMINLKQRILDAKQKLLDIPFQIIDPSKGFYYYWTFVVYVGFLYNSYMCVIFVFDDTMDGTSSFFNYWLAFNFFFDFINTVDIFICSKLTLMEDGMTIRSWRHLAKRYFKSRNFTFDTLAVMPTDLFLLLWPHCSLLRINRLLKVHRVLDFVERTNMKTNYPNGFRIFHIIIICIVLFHWNAALYYKISLMGENSCKQISTIAQMENYSCIKAWEFKYIKIEDPIFATCDILLTEVDERCGINETDPDDRVHYIELLSSYWENKIQSVLFSNFTKQYSLSIYWSSLTLTTSGQQPYPSEALHNMLEIFDTIVGVLVFAVIVGSVGNVVSTMNRDRAEIQQLMDGIKFYMNYRNVSIDMQKRVLDCVGYIQHYGMIQDESSIMKSIPPRLQGELAVHLHMDTLRRVELLSDCKANLLYELVLRLQLHMFSPNDFLTRCGDVAKEMFIVKSGILQSLSPSGELLDTFEEGSTFGELSILKMVGAEKSNRRVRSLRSVGYSEVYILKQEDVLDVLRDYPDAKHNLISKARDLIRIRGNASIEDGGEFLNDAALQAQQMLASQNINEKLEILEGALKGIDTQLDDLYETFRKESSNMKKRMTRLEEIFQENRHIMKEERFQLINRRLA